MKGPLQQQKELKNLLLLQILKTNELQLGNVNFQARLKSLEDLISNEEPKDIHKKMESIIVLLQSLNQRGCQLENSPEIPKVLKIIMNLLVRLENKCIPKYTTSIVYLLMSQLTRSNFNQFLKGKQKIQIIRNWKFNNVDVNIQQSSLAISSFIIQQASPQNLQQALILLYTLVQFKAKIQDSTLLSLNWLLRKSIKTFNQCNIKYNELIVFFARYFVDKIQTMKLTNQLALKTYANFLIILLHLIQEKQQIKQIEHHFKSFNLIECLYTILPGQSFRQSSGKYLIGEEKQDLFLQLVILFIKTDHQIIKRCIKFIVKINSTPIMISNCLSLFNTDNNHLIIQTGRIKRAHNILQIFQEEYKQQPKICLFSKKGSWIYRLIQKKSIGLVLLKIQINHPLLRNGEKQSLLKIEFQKGVYNLFICFSDPKNPGIKLILKRQGKSNQQSKYLQQLVVLQLQSILINITIQFKMDNKVAIYGQEMKIFDISSGILGRTKALLIGTREDESAYCGIQKIYSMSFIEDVSMDQYLKQKIIFENQNNQFKKTQLQGRFVKNNILEEIENPKQKKVLQKLRLSSKSLTFANIQMRYVKTYREIMDEFKGIQRLIAYLLNAVETINNNTLLTAYIKFIRKQLSNLQLSENNFFEIFFIHGFSIFLRKPLNVINQISDIILEMNKQVFKNKKITNSRMIYLIQMKLNLFLNMKEEQQSHRLITFFEQFLKKTINQSMEKGYIVCRKISENLNYSLWNCINDNILQNDHNLEQNQIKNLLLKQGSSLSNNSISNDQEISNYKPNHPLNFLYAQKDFKYFPSTVRRILNVIVNNCSNDTFLFNQFVSYLNLVLVILSGLSLSGGKRFKINQLIIVLQQIYNIFIQLSIQFAKMKQLPQQGQKIICILLSQLYNLLPTISILCKLSTVQQGDTQENFYKVYTSTDQREYNFKTNQAFGLISKFYNICFQIGSFCLKGRKNGFLSYMDYALRFLSQYKDELQWSEKTDVLTYKDRIALTEIYASCWKFVVGNSRSKSLTKFELDKDTKIELADRLNELNYGIYCPYPINQQNNKNIIKQIIQLHMLESIEDKLPSYILANIGPKDLEHIMEQIKQNIDKNKKIQKEQRLRLYLLMIEIINEYDRPIILEFQSDQFKKLPQFNKKSQLIFKWYEIYKRIKKIHQQYSISKEQFFSNNLQLNHQFQTSLRQPFVRVLDKLGENKTFQKIRIIINNFVIDNKGQIDVNGIQPMDQNKNLYVFKLLRKECLDVNAQMFQQKRRKVKKFDNLKIGLKSNEPNIFFITERSQIQKENLSQNQKKDLRLVSQKVAKKILLNNRAYFMEMHTKLSKDKTNILNGYYHIIERLSAQEKMLNWGNSKKYDYYNYYILDDYLSEQNVKLMLKRDNVLVFSSMIFGQIPRLVQSKLQLQCRSITYAISIAKNLFDLNSNKFFEFVNEKIKVYEPHKGIKQKGREKLTSVKLNAYLITKSKIYQGRIQINNEYIQFSQNNYIDQNVYVQFYANHSEKRTYQEIAVSKKALKIEISTIKYSHPKKYLQKYPSLQVYASSLSYFFVFDNKEDREKFLNCSKIENRTTSDNVQFINQLCQAWEKRWISNFQYIMTINNIAGRSLNDVSQYYIFPWTVKNFNGVMDQAFMKTKSNFRELNKSIGSINPKKLEVILNKYANSIVESDIKQRPYMFGGFYSNSAIVCNYLLRVNPFTVHHYQLQGKHFDLYDRLFTNMQSQFDSVFNNTMDNRQLLPEFYSAPQFFRNRNRYNFSYNPKKDRIDLKMNMPEWVITKSPEEFVLRMRKVLQSDTTSQKLGEWIDMIFGKKSQIEYAAQNHNLYVHYLYKTKQFIHQRQLTQSQKQDLESQTQTKAHMIKQFGQVPKNIFGNKLSPKMTNRQFKQNIVLSQKIKIELMEQNNKTQDGSIIFDFNDCILVFCHKNLLTIVNTAEDLSRSRYVEVLQQQVIRVSVSNIKKTKFILIFVISISGKLLVLNVKRNMKGTLFIGKKQQFKIDKRLQIFPLIKFGNVKTVSNYVILTQRNIMRIIKITKEFDKQKNNNIISELIQDQKTDERRFFYDLGIIYLHRSNIVYLEVYPYLEIVVSVDQSGFVNTFSLVPELTIRGTFLLNQLKASESVNKIIVHSIGLLVILTNLRQLMVYNIYGDLIQKVKFQIGISDLVFWDSKSSSQILLSTKSGEIHQLDLFEMIKPGEDCLSGQTIQFSTNPNSFIKVNDKSNNKLIMDRFGKYWSVYVLCSVHQNYIYLCQKDFFKIYNTKKFLRCCNQNNSYKNS